MTSSAPVLETPRLRLRGWRPGDFAALAAMLGDPEVARFGAADGRAMDHAQSWRTLALMMGHWDLRGFGMFAVEERETGAFVGRVGPWSPEGWIGVELGWGLAREHWGKGYATEAAYAAGVWAFAQAAPEELVSLIHVDNVRSQNVAQRLGERPGAATFHAGQPHVIWRATRREWRMSQKR